jgi:D-alanine transaminase
MGEIAYVNGVFRDLADATVSIEDRGFQFADGVYEVIVAPQGRPFRLEDHLTRLKRSADAIELQVDFDAVDLPGVIMEGIRRCGFEDVMIYVQITRGAAPRDHLCPADISPTIVATFKAKPVHDSALRERGVALESVSDIRWEACSVKSIALLPNVLIKNRAKRRGFFDAVIVGPDGMVRETSCANVFMVRDGILHTPPATDHILHGITRRLILECAGKIGVQSREEEFDLPSLMAADEVFISSTTMDVMPVTSVDAKPIGRARPGPVSGRLLECVRAEMAGG